MATANLADKDRARVVRGQLSRMSAKNRIVLIKRLSADQDLDNPFVNVVDKGMAPPLPAPQNVTPDDNDDDTGTPDVAAVPDVEDAGLQRGGAKRRPVPQRRVPQRRPPQRVASAEQKQWAAMELAELRVAAGMNKPENKVKLARRIAAEMSMDAIVAAVQTMEQMRSASQRTAAMPTRPQVRRGSRPMDIAGRRSAPQRQLPARAASQNQQEEALTALALELSAQ